MRSQSQQPAPRHPDRRSDRQADRQADHDRPGDREPQPLLRQQTSASHLRQSQIILHAFTACRNIFLANLFFTLHFSYSTKTMNLNILKSLNKYFQI